MGNEVTKVVQKAGLVGAETVEELRRWGAPIPPPAPGPEPDPSVVPVLIERAMGEEDFVRVRETDLELLHQYLKTQQAGELYLKSLDGKEATVGVVFGRTAVGEYIIPWVEGDVAEVALDCTVELKIPGAARVVLTNPRELYYGDKKVFTVWQEATCLT
jgi:hypothetical protein